MIINGHSISRVQVGAFLECTDLIKNGYMLCFCVVQDKFWFYKFKHISNGRTLVLKWIPDEYTISEGKAILKKCSNDSVR